MVNDVYNDFENITIEEFEKIYTSLKKIKDDIILRIKNYFKECGSYTKKYEIRKLYNLILSKLEVLVNEANTLKRLAYLPTGKSQVHKSKIRTLNYLKSKSKTKLSRELNSNVVTNSINNIPEEYVNPQIGELQNNYGPQIMNKLRSRKARRKIQRKYNSLRNPKSAAKSATKSAAKLATPKSATKSATPKSATKSATPKSTAKSATKSATQTIRTAQKTFTVTRSAANNNGVGGKKKSKRSIKKPASKK